MNKAILTGTLAALASTSTLAFAAAAPICQWMPWGYWCW